MRDDPKPAKWQTKPCPPWCAREHRDNDHPDDRFHDSARTVVPTIFAQPDRVAARGRWILESDDLTIVTSQHEKNATAITFIGREDRVGQELMMAPESAARLAESLLAHLATLEEK